MTDRRGRALGTADLGASHAYCNLRAAADTTNERRNVTPVEQPYRWSRRWHDEPPAGTINLDGGRNPEIYVGNGEWQPLDTAAN